MSPRFKKLLSLTALVSLSAEGAQVIENAHQKTVQVHVSAHESNRLAIDGGQLTSVVPAQPNVIDAKADEANGALYFTYKNAASAGPLTLFVTDDEAHTYTLLLIPRDIPATELVVRPPAVPVSKAEPLDAMELDRAVKDLVLTLHAPEHYNVAIRKVNQEELLWREARFVLQSERRAGPLLGQKYSLTNISSIEMVVHEPELYTPGVLTVAILRHTLQPGESTEVYIVRDGSRHE